MLRPLLRTPERRRSTSEACRGPGRPPWARPPKREFPPLNSQVYQASWRRSRIAVKRLLCQRLTETARAEFMQEMELMSNLRHPNIVRFLGACLEPLQMSILFELCATSLFEVLHARQRGARSPSRLPWAIGRPGARPPTSERRLGSLDARRGLTLAPRSTPKMDGCFRGPRAGAQAGAHDGVRHYSHPTDRPRHLLPAPVQAASAPPRPQVGQRPPRRARHRQGLHSVCTPGCIKSTPARTPTPPRSATSG